MMRIGLTQIDSAAFAPFGEIIAYGAGAGRHPVEAAFQPPAADHAPRMWINRLAGSAAGEIVVRQLEQHPHSAQSFVPLGGGGLIAIVCPPSETGGPDPAGLRAFRVPPRIGIVYRAGVWHHGLIAMADVDVVVVMSLSERGDDTVLYDLRDPWIVTGRDGNPSI